MKKTTKMAAVLAAMSVMVIGAVSTTMANKYTVITFVPKVKSYVMLEVL